MRVDKYLSETAVASRRETAKAVREGAVSVGGVVVKRADAAVREGVDEVVYRGQSVPWRRFFYLMLNKPAGVISASSDGKNDKTVLGLLPEKYAKAGCFPCGRLDRDTTGLLLITNDGDTAHKLLSPRYHIGKSYRYTCDKPLPEDGAARLLSGVHIGEGEDVRASALEACGNSGVITVTEGKFHQIKRMLYAVGCEVLTLERVSFAGLSLDGTLEYGMWRELTDAEINTITGIGDIKE